LAAKKIRGAVKSNRGRPSKAEFEGD